MKAKETDNGFQKFWDTYALKRDRIAAERAWKRLSAKERQAALAGIDSYRQDCEKRGISRMYAQGYLNHRRWEDDNTDNIQPNNPIVASVDRSLENKDIENFKAALYAARSRHLDSRNETALRKLLSDMSLYSIDDIHERVCIRCQHTSFNREFTVPWYWEPETFDNIVARFFNGYTLISYEDLIFKKE